MKKARCTEIQIALVLLCAAVLAPAVLAQDTITVKDTAYVKGPKILLGDVADITGDNAEELALVEIAPAALPGSVKRIDAALLMMRVKNAGIDVDTFDFKGHRRVSAKTLHLDITPGMLAENLRQFIEVEMPWDPTPTEIEIVPPTQTFAVPDGEVEFRWKPNPRYAYLGSGAFRGEVLVDGKVARSVMLKANVQTYADVVVAAESVARGEPLTARNTRLDKRELSRLDDGAFFSLKDIQGNVARTSIPRGQVLTSRKVTLPQLIKRNQIITVETRVGSLVIRAQARALSKGAVGDLVQCAALSSKEQFTGILRKDGVVEVP